MSGTLIELVELLSQRGRKFVYVPQPVQSDTQPVAVDEVSADDDGQPAVYWKSPEAWQAPAALADAPLADPMESMMRQLAGGQAAVPASFASPVTADRSAQPDAPLAPARASKPATTRAMPREERGMTHRAAHATGGAVQVAEWRGYTMSLTVQPVRNRMFRGAVEILKDGKRVERSGLIGPPFQDRESARNFAFDWAREWVERDGAPESASGASFPVSHSARHCAAQGVVQGVPQAALGGTVPSAPGTGANLTRGGDAASAVIMRSLPPAVPGSVRLAPLQRYTATGTLLTGSEARDAGTAGSGTAERHPAGTRYRTLSR